MTLIRVQVMALLLGRDHHGFSDTSLLAKLVTQEGYLMQGDNAIHLAERPQIESVSHETA